MGYERYPRGTDPERDTYGRRDNQDYGRDYGSGRDYSYSSARDYAAAGAFGGDRDRDQDRNDRWNRDDDDRGYGRREYGNAGYAQGGDRYGSNRSSYGREDRYGSGSYGGASSGSGSYGGGSYGGSSYGSSSYGNRQDFGRDRDDGRDQSRYARGDEYHGSYASDGRRFEDVGQRRHWDDDNYRGRQQAQQQRGQSRGDYGRQPQGYDYDDRGFLARAGDEVRSWFGDEDAERRREMDSRYDERYYNQQQHHRDADYHNWRSGQIAALDRDYDEYRSENRSKFENEFSSWRSNRQTQRQSLDKVKEHAEVVGSDGSHVGTVDKVRGDRILLTKNDADAGGQHHSIPSSWIQSVEDKKVTLSKTADEAKRQWRDEEQNQALFRYGDNNRDRQSGQHGQTGQTGQYGQTGTSQTGDQGNTNLNRSFSGTYDDKKS